MNKITRMKELIAELNNAANAYYNTAKPIMSDAEFDSNLKIYVHWKKKQI